MKIVVHRGANDKAPENTMASAQPCVDLGVGFVEIDVRGTIDRVHYVLHDQTLDRTTNGHGPIRRHRASYVDRLDAGSWFAPEFAGERVPRLEEFLDWAAGRIGVYLDVKGGDLREIVRMIRDRGMERDVFFWFGSTRRLRRFRRLESTLPLMIASRTPGEVRRHKAEFNHQIVEQGPDQSSRAVIQTCRELGIRTMANIIGRQNAPDDEVQNLYQSIVELGYDMVNLDRPEPFVEFLRKRGM